MNPRKELEEAYRRTRYLLRLPAEVLELRVGRHEPRTGRRLAEQTGCRSDWALVTPCNPRSRPLLAWQNRLRLQAMAAGLVEYGLAHYPTLHRDPDGRWPDEAGFLLVDPPRGLARALGRRYRQNAIVVARLGEAPRLEWLI